MWGGGAQPASHIDLILCYPIEKINSASSKTVMATSVLAAAVLLFFVLVIPTQGQDCSPLPCFGCSDTGSAITITCAGGGLTSFPSLPDDVQPRVDELVLRSNQITELTTADLVNYTILETL